jgi:two-component system, LytTR family, response regulator LytT
MKKYRVMIVDDEPIAQRIIQGHCSYLASLTIVKISHNALEAMEFLNENSVDIIFLDLNMPKLHGFDMLKALRVEAQIIVTTAYSEYALDGYAHSICDYLMKPISIESFVVATNRAIKKVDTAEISKPENQSKQLPIQAETDDKTIFIKSEKMHHQVALKDILFIEACGNYCAVQLVDKKLMAYQKISSFEEKLSSKQFIRIHKSYLCSIRKIEKIANKSLFVAQYELAIGQSYREKVFKLV